jgi:hypothetical protein
MVPLTADDLEMQLLHHPRGPAHRANNLPHTEVLGEFFLAAFKLFYVNEHEHEHEHELDAIRA